MKLNQADTIGRLCALLQTVNTQRFNGEHIAECVCPSQQIPNPEVSEDIFIFIETTVQDALDSLKTGA